MRSWTCTMEDSTMDSSSGMKYQRFNLRTPTQVVNSLVELDKHIEKLWYSNKIKSDEILAVVVGKETCSNAKGYLPTIKVKNYYDNGCDDSRYKHGYTDFINDMFESSLTHFISDIGLEKNYYPGVWGVKIRLKESNDGHTNITSEVIEKVVERFLKPLKD